MLDYIIFDKNEINIEEHEIFSFDILRKTDLNIFVIKNNRVLYKNNIINNASQHGHIQVLEWFKNSCYEFKYNESTINFASINGHVLVLEWFKNSGYEFKYNEWAINYAFLNGHIQVLEWFKNSNYKFKYTKWGIINNTLPTRDIKILKFYSNINIKKLIKWSKTSYFIKTNNKYLKGYQKN